MELIQNAVKNADGQDGSHRTGKGMDIILDCLNSAVSGGELLPGTPVEDLALIIIFTMHGSIVHLQKYDANYDILN